MLSAIGTGKTIEKAIEEALLELKASREDVDIHVLSEGGLFKKAKVEVKISDDAKEKYIKKDERRKAEKVEIAQTQIVKEEVEEQIQKDVKKALKEAEKDTKKALKDVEKEVAKIVEEVNKKDYSPKMQKASKPEKRLDPMEFLKGFFKALNREVEITTLEDDKYVTYSIEGENLGDVIGRHGDGFYALTKLVQAVCGHKEKRIILDVDGYRAKREESLTSLALRTANKVAKSGRYLKLDPMNPSERRIIHTALQNDDRVTTLSKGTEPRRYVIIFPKEYKEK